MRKFARFLRLGLARAASGYVEATGWLGGLAVLLLCVGALALLVESQSPSSLLWTGQPVPARERGDTVLYSFHGIAYYFQSTGRANDAPLIPVTVYLDPRQPDDAVLDKLSTRIFDASFVLTPLALAGICGLVGWRRIRAIRRRYRRLWRRPRAWPGLQGYGFAPGELRGQRPEASPGDEAGDLDWPPGAA